MEGLADDAPEREPPAGLSEVDASFAGQIATAVWIGKLDEEAAREALLSYAIACQLCERTHLIRLREALLAEYRHCRERQDLVS
jgi:hypothetical protein